MEIPDEKYFGDRDLNYQLIIYPFDLGNHEHYGGPVYFIHHFDELKDSYLVRDIDYRYKDRKNTSDFSAMYTTFPYENIDENEYVFEFNADFFIEGVGVDVSFDSPIRSGIYYSIAESAEEAVNNFWKWKEGEDCVYRY